ncbi:hypothetical protein MC7420_5120 [Coleofasciculus chthonoplastes PCC 7420]|uniref:Uncharacterized protein n=1 Tax=Coleofasciculus chthonoplastes PCC 7420 TaxID=118168 RepID=B4W1F4_9CYAN|nr:hypothetical protein MC7420_5120 [Coleofasciculus chthonoplastes PCC 7420]
MNLADECYIHLKQVIQISLQNVKLRQAKQAGNTLKKSTKPLLFA